MRCPVRRWFILLLLPWTVYGGSLAFFASPRKGLRGSLTSPVLCPKVAVYRGGDRRNARVSPRYTRWLLLPERPAPMRAGEDFFQKPRKVRIARQFHSGSFGLTLPFRGKARCKHSTESSGSHQYHESTSTLVLEVAKKRNGAARSRKEHSDLSLTSALRFGRSSPRGPGRRYGRRRRQARELP